MFSKVLYALAWTSAFLAATPTQATDVNIQLMGLHGVLVNDTFTQYTLAEEVTNVAMLMGAYMCENKISTVVSELSGMSSTCSDLTFNFVATDSQYDPATAVQVLLSGIESSSSTNFVVGPTRSSSAIPTSLVAGSEKIGILSPQASSEDLSDRYEYSNFLRVIPSDLNTATITAQLMDSYGWDYVGLIYQQDTYGTTYRDSLLEEMEDLGITLYSEGFDLNDSSGAKLGMETLKDLDLNIVLIIASGSDLETIVEYAVENDMTSEGKLLIFMDLVSRAELAAIANKSETYKSALQHQQHILLDTTYGSSVSTKFLNQWTALSSSSTFLSYVNARLPGGSSFLAPETGSYVTRTVTSSFFSSTKDSDLASTVALSFDAVVSACWAYCVASGDGKNVSDITEILDTLTDSDALDLSGMSGDIVIDPKTGGRSMSSISFQLTSITYESDALVFAEVASWTNEEWDMLETVVFPGNTTSVPKATSSAEENLNLIGTPVRALVWLMMVATEAICGFYIFFVISNKTSKVIVKSQPEFLVLCIIGVMISTSSVIPLGMDEGILKHQFGLNFSCNAWVPLWAIGNTFIYGALITKLYRILRIFDNPSLRTMRIRNKDMYLCILGMLLVTIIVSTIWISVAPQYWQRRRSATWTGVSVDDYGNVLESYGICTDHKDVKGIFYGIIFSKNGLKLAGATFMAFKCRHVDKQFQESIFIFMAVASMLQVYLLGLPVMFAIDVKETSIRFLVLGMIICITNFVLATLLIMPKMRMVRELKASTEKGVHQTADEDASTSAIKKDKFVVSENDEFANALRQQGPSISFAEMYPTRESDDGSDGDVSDAEDEEMGQAGNHRSQRSILAQTGVRIA